MLCCLAALSSLKFYICTLLFHFVPFSEDFGNSYVMFPRLIRKFKVILIKIPTGFSNILDTLVLKIHTEEYMLKNDQGNSKKTQGEEG